MADERRNLVQYKSYVAGWLDSTIHDFLGVFPPRTKRMSHALLTCIDSNRDLTWLLAKSPELETLTDEVTRCGKGLILPTKRLLDTDAKSQYLFGFDEIYFFPSDQIEPKPESVTLVGPARVTQKSLEKLGQWMESNACSLALGDGEGLNVIVKARGLVRYLIGHSLEQSEPSFAPIGTADSA